MSAHTQDLSTGSISGRKLPSSDRATFVMSSLPEVTPELVAFARERDLTEIDAERFGDQQGWTLVDSETGTTSHPAKLLVRTCV